MLARKRNAGDAAYWRVLYQRERRFWQEQAEKDRIERERLMDSLMLATGAKGMFSEQEPKPAPEPQMLSNEELQFADSQLELDEMAQRAAMDPSEYEYVHSRAEVNPVYWSVLEHADQIRREIEQA